MRSHILEAGFPLLGIPRPRQETHCQSLLALALCPNCMLGIHKIPHKLLPVIQHTSFAMGPRFEDIRLEHNSIQYYQLKVEGGEVLEKITIYCDEI